MENKFYCNLDNGNMLKKLIVKIGLERINIQKEVIIEVFVTTQRF